MALVALLSKYDFLTCDQTVETVTLDPAAILGAPKDPLIIKIRERNV